MTVVAFVTLSSFVGNAFLAWLWWLYWQDATGGCNLDAEGLCSQLQPAADKA